VLVQGVLQRGGHDKRPESFVVDLDYLEHRLDRRCAEGPLCTRIQQSRLGSGVLDPFIERQ
jgi:hypothetical protein